MRAVLVKNEKGPVENLYIGEIETPNPQDGEVLVKIKAFGLNRMDIYQRIGGYPVPAGASQILGVEFSGVVHALGNNSTKWKIGDEVFGLVGGGAYAEFALAPEGQLLPKPSHLSWAEAASIPEAFLTAYQALILICDFKKDESVLVHAGASGVGVAAIQLARFLGASSVITTASTQEKLAWLHDTVGATHTANYKTSDFSETVKSATEGHGVDVIVDFVGQSHWAKNIDSLAVDGRMVILAFLSGANVPEVDLGQLLRKRLRIQGSTLRSRTLSSEKGTGALKTYIHKVYPWTEIQAATREMETAANSGKIIAEIV
ncbi:quinone oxidoreductase [Auriculariales sp. MPI-PUGE-AT-0066]|nr:quinone oxidoreductase [Auriculariales sp. MPI-PUGE-AT-0066]